MFSGLRIEALPPTQYRVSVYTLVLKRRTEKFNFRYVVNLIKLNTSFWLSTIGSPGADLSALRALQALSVRPIWRPSVPIRQDFWVDLSAYRSQMVNLSIWKHHPVLCFWPGWLAFMGAVRCMWSRKPGCLMVLLRSRLFEWGSDLARWQQKSHGTPG